MILALSSRAHQARDGVGGFLDFQVGFGPTGAGVPVQYPRLAGQFSEYTATQLKAFRAGERGNDPNRTMRAIAEKLSDREIAAVAEYISGLR